MFDALENEVAALVLKILVEYQVADIAGDPIKIDFSLSALPESKITTLVLGWLEDSVIRSDSPAVGVAESFSTCADIWIVW